MLKLQYRGRILCTLPVKKRRASCMKSQPFSGSCEQSGGAWGLLSGCRNFEHLEQQAAPQRLRPTRSEWHCQRRNHHRPVYFCNQLVKEQEAGKGSQVIHKLNNTWKRGGRWDEQVKESERGWVWSCLQTHWGPSIQLQEAKNNGQAGGRGGNERVYAEYSILKLGRLVEKWKLE